MRLIDADKLKKALGITSEDCNKCDWGSYESCGRGYDFEDACVAIDNAVTVDAVPVRHGRWETVEDWDGDERYKCSVCGDEWFLEVGNPEFNNMNYCPKCGARMDGKDGDGNG